MTAEQLALPIAALVHAEPDPDLTIAERFDQFHALNPWVLQALEALVSGWLARGHKRVGIKAAFEVIRWNYGMTTTDEPFRCNNDFTSRYARLLIERHPEWEAAIETRRLRAA